MASLSRQILLVPDNKNTPTNLRNQPTSMGLILRLKVKYIHGCFGAQVFE